MKIIRNLIGSFWPKPVFLCLFILLMFLMVYFVFSNFYEDNYNDISEVVSSDEFLMDLQNKSPDGCIALMHMDSVDVVLVGSSTAYSHVDAYILSEGFEGSTVGVCALAAWNADFFDYFFLFLKENHIDPDRIIWLVDQYSHLELTNHDKRKAYAISVFSDEALQQKKLEEWIEAYMADDYSRRKAKSEYNQKIDRHEEEISFLSLETVEEIVRQIEFPSVATLAKVLETAKPNPDNKNKLRKICDHIEQHSIHLDIVIAPIPKETELAFSKGEASLSSLEGVGLREYYQKYVQCERSLVEASLKDWGLDARYFVNRKLKPAYPYEIWNDRETFQARYDAMHPKLRSQLYDDSHMNGVGAVLFTEDLVAAIK